MDRSPCFYTIDNDDRIISLSENWLIIAVENDALEKCYPDRVVGESIWSFISGSETQEIYKLIFDKVRTDKATITLPFRCDAPLKRRYMELTICPMSHGQLKIVSYIINEEKTDYVGLLDLTAVRSGKFVTVCSMCKKVELVGHKWVEIDVAVKFMNLFEKEGLPQVYHSLCPLCIDATKAEISDK